MPNFKWGRYTRDDYVMIYASSLAQCAGMHKYEPQSDLINPTFITKDELAQKELELMPIEQQNLIQEVAMAKYENAVELSSALGELTHLTPTLVESVKKTMYTRHGTEQEPVIRSATSKVMKKQIVTNHKFVASKEPMITVEGIEVYIGGKHDGMVNNKIVEIKTRQNRFLGTPVYELVQVHAYMHIFGTREALLVESYMGVERNHEIVFDDGFWTTIKENVSQFIGLLNSNAL